MEKESIFDNIRAPILNTIYRNPFEGLNDHSKKMDECVAYMGQCLISYIECDFEKVHQFKKKVSETEHEADLIKSNIRSHLPKSVFISVRKDQFHMLLHDADSILDYAEDVAVLLTMKETCIPDEISNDLRALSEKVLECVEKYQKVMNLLEKLREYSSRSGERKKVKDLIKDVHRLEHEADVVEFGISKKLFNLSDSDLDPISIIHLLKVIDRLGQVADKAENAADRVRAMIAK